MALLNINPTRMELLNLKRRLVVARRGHKLLKDKQDELIRQFMEYINTYKDLRKEIDTRLPQLFKANCLINSQSDKKIINRDISSTGNTEADIEMITITSVPVPKVNIPEIEISKDYSSFQAHPNIINVLEDLKNVLPQLLNLMDIKKIIEKLAFEIERTRRRVNALEYILIPNLEETVKYISMKLSELERSFLTQLMRVKDIVRSK